MVEVLKVLLKGKIIP